MNYPLVVAVTAITFLQVAAFTRVWRDAVGRSISLGYLWPALALFNIELSSFVFLTGLIRAFKDVGQVSTGSKVAFLHQEQSGSATAAMIALIGFMAMVAMAFAYSRRPRKKRHTVSRKRLILTYAPVIVLFAAFAAAAGVFSYWSMQWLSLPDTFTWPAGEGRIGRKGAMVNRDKG